MNRRVIVALDESAASQAALESAVRLAHAASAELIGLFIEDVTLFSVTVLPGSSVITYQGAETMPLDTALLERSLRLRARRLRETVARISQAHRVAWQFETVRGEVSREILRLAGTGDIIALGASMHGRPGIFGSTAHSVLMQAQCSVLVVQARLPPAPRVLVLADEPEAAMPLAASLADNWGALLAVKKAPETRGQAYDMLARLAPPYLIIDRAALSRLDIDPRDLARRFKPEGLIVVGPAAG